jgi:hypothetical protein
MGLDSEADDLSDNDNHKSFEVNDLSDNDNE